MLLILPGLLYPGSSGPGGNRIKFEHISLDQGLSQSIVNCILQDNRGYLWLGTQDGLNRFDGYTFKVFSWDPDNKNTLTHSYIRDLIQDRSGILWIGTDGGGLNRFDPKTEIFSHYMNVPGDSSSLGNNSIGTILEDTDGILWIGTHGSGLNRFDPKTGIFTRFPVGSGIENGISNSHIYDIIQDRGGRLWLATGEGLNRFDPINGVVKRFGRQTFHCLCLDRSGILWAGTDNSGVIRFDPKRETTRVFRPVAANPNSLSHLTVMKIYEDNSGILWIGTRGGGLNRFDPVTERFTRFYSDSQFPGSLSSNLIRSIYQDRGNVLWIGTNGGGVNKYDPKTRAFMYFAHDPSNRNSLKDNSITGLLETNNDTLWVGTGTGLTRYNFKTNQFKRYDPLCRDIEYKTDIRVRCIRRDLEKPGYLWLATSSGLFRFNTGNGRFTCFSHDPKRADSLSSNQVSYLFQDNKNVLWAGTLDNGFNRFEPSSNKSKRFKHIPGDKNSLTHNCCYFLHKDRFGIFWIGTYDGLTAFNPVSGSYDRYINGPNYSNQSKIICFCEDHSRKLWFGSIGGGLFSVDPASRELRRYSKKEGLGNNVVYGILEDKNHHLWLSTNKGLFRFDPVKRDFAQYDESDGLQSNEFNIFSYHHGQSGRFYFGGINGLTAFLPHMIRKNPHVPPVVITGISKLNRELGEISLNPNIDQLVFNYDDYVFSFEFSALDYSAPSKNRYSYMLEGFNEEWMTAGANRRTATYTNLDPGDYTFKVKGTNNHGIWNETPVSINVKILPPFWKTDIFKGIAIFVVLFAGYFIYRLRVRSINKKKEELEFQVAERTKSLGERTSELEMFNTILKAINAGVELTDLLESVVLEIARFLAMEKAAAYFYNTRKDLYMFKAGVGWNNNNSNVESQPKNLTKKEIIDQYILPAEKVMDDIYLCRPGTSNRGHLVMVIRAKNAVAGYLVFESIHTQEPPEKRALPILQKLKQPLVSAFSRGLLMFELKVANEKAEREQKAAEIANRSKSDFLARMSHEIRTPMNSVIGFTDMLMETDPTEEQSDYIRTIHRSGEALLSLINDILDFSKVESGMLTLENIEFDPAEIAYDVCKMVQPRIGNKPVELLCRISDRLPHRVKGDPGRFRQVLVNLMGNAVKFTKAGEVDLLVDVREQDEHSVFIHTTVTDTGIGIEQDKIDSVFQLFQQADGSTTRQFGGSGLGLPICRQLSQLMNGHVWAESTPDKGSTFHFTAKLQKITYSRYPEETTLQPQIFEGKRVLIAEDNLNQLKTISTMLEELGITAAGCLKSEEVVDVLQSAFRLGQGFDLCILDIGMPTLSGHDVARAIRSAKPPLSEIPLLALSSSASGSSEEHRNSGFDTFIYKPTQKKVMVKTLSMLFGGEKPLAEQKKEKKHLPPVREKKQEKVPDSELIMLVEDNPINRKLATYILTRAGYPYEVAENGKEAVDKFTENPKKFSLILMDIQTPIMNGLEAVAHIREKGFANIPVIAMTAQSIKGDRERCIDAGMNDYIAKPIRKELLLTMIRKWTSIHKSTKVHH